MNKESNILKEDGVRILILMSQRHILISAVNVIPASAGVKKQAD
jgi:hypothetical protein